MATYFERQKILREEFKDLEMEQASQEELFTFLDKKLGRQFDREVANQLYLKASKGQLGNITIDSFIDSIIQAEDSLKSKINTCRKTLEENYRMKQESEQKLNEVSINEQLNMFGVMNGSQCSVTILEAVNLKFSDLSKVLDPFVTVKMDKQEFQTALGKSSNPQWSPPQTFFLDVQSGREDLQISVCDYDKFTANVVIGRVNLNLLNNQINLRSQKKLDVWLNLYDQYGNTTGGQIHIQIQWIYSRVRFITDALNEYKSQLFELEAELNDYETDLKTIYEPFKKWQFLYRGILNQPARAPEAGDKLGQFQGVNIQNIVTPRNKMQPYNDLLLEPIREFTFLKFLMGTLLLFLTLECFARAVFYDFLIVFDFIILYEWNALSQNKLISLGMMFGFSIFLDIPWLIIFFKPYIDATQTQDPNTLRFVGLLALLCFFIKLGITAMLFYLQNLIKMNVVTKQPQVLRVDIQGGNASKLAGSRLYLTNGKAVEIY